MPDPEETNPEQDPNTEGQDPEGQDPQGDPQGDSQGQDQKGQKGSEGDIQEPPERKSETEKYKEEMEQDKRMKRIEYQTRKLKEENENLKKQLGEDYKAPESSSTQGEPEGGDDSKVFDELDKKERQMEVKEFVKDNPEYEDLKPSLEKFIEHPAYKKVPVDFIAKALGSDRAEKIGAERAAKAQKQSQMSQVGGHPAKPKQNQPKDWLSTSNEEFEKELAKVKRGQ